MRIVVTVEGGNVSGVITDSGHPVEFVVVDYDTDGSAPADLKQILQDDGSMAECHVWNCETDVDEVFVANAFGLIANEEPNDQ